MQPALPALKELFVFYKRNDLVKNLKSTDRYYFRSTEFKTRDKWFIASVTAASLIWVELKTPNGAVKIVMKAGLEAMTCSDFYCQRRRYLSVLSRGEYTEEWQQEDGNVFDEREDSSDDDDPLSPEI